MVKQFLVMIIICVWAGVLVAKPPVTEGETDLVMLAVDPYLISALRGGDSSGRWGSTGSIVNLVMEPDFLNLVKKHDLALFNGPMVGCLTPTSAKVWFRTAGTAIVSVVVEGVSSEAVTTRPEGDFTGVAQVLGLKPFTEYSYSLMVNGKTFSRDYFRFKTAPKAGDGAMFSLTFGSGARYVPKNEGIWRVMAKTRPIAYLGLGDNLYIDEREKQNVQRLHYYRRMLRQEYREFIAGTSVYAVWDDHDMGANDCEGGYGLEAPWKLANLQVFRQNWNNPVYGIEPKGPGTYHSFRLGDVEVFMTDGRFYRYGRKSKREDSRDDRPFTMLGEVQKQWLLNSLKKSTATFKVLASGTMWHAKADKGGADSWAGPKSAFQKERDEIFDLISREAISGVVLISGDRHRTDIWKTERTDHYPLYEFLSAKLTNMHGHGVRKDAVWSYSGGDDRFWGQLDFDTTVADPTVTFKAINHLGKELKSFTLTLSELSDRNSSKDN